MSDIIVRREEFLALAAKVQALEEKLKPAEPTTEDQAAIEAAFAEILKGTK